MTVNSTSTGKPSRDAAAEAHTYIRKVVLSNFKKFESLQLDFAPDLNIFAGDNEAGKSTAMLAIDLALAASRSKVETIGIEALMRKNAVQAFLAGTKNPADLPTLFVEIYLSEAEDPDLHGRCNSLHESAFGIRFTCEPSDDYALEIKQVLAEKADNFPFEFYSIKFSTFAGAPYGARSRLLRHLLIDGAQINADYAQREYTRALYRSHASPSERGTHENKYRQSKDRFWNEHLVELNAKLSVQFQVRSSSKSNLEADLVIAEGGIPLDARGRGRQSLIKTEFALSKGKGPDEVEVLLLEEPENHLSHVNMRRLLDKLAMPRDKQLFVSTHSSLVCSRLDLRKVIMMDASGNRAMLRGLDQETANFFCKAPDNNVLEFAMSRKVILVEGDAEFILIAALYQSCTGASLESDGVHVIAVGGTSFKRYLALAKVLNIRTAVIRDNDGDYQKHCVENYSALLDDNARVFADNDDDRRTFEICVYEDNKDVCEKLFGAARRSLSVLDWMLDNKAEAALALLEKAGSNLNVPSYLREAIEWVRQ
ncbi:ATP-dependent nuclease [Burkholderia territorii]|uniref:ATP-dependent nuclease n=1 Tax=Burkholderia territorii TaxID=1503055 RepID=UPI0009C023F3|nr:TOPRIM nucleotidyl transferase/hydrolase domain-containing protein [Burkholderia territorii]